MSPPRSSPWAALAAASSLFASSARAEAPRGSVFVVHPLNVVEARDEAEVQRLRALFLSQVEALGLTVADPSCVSRFLSAREDRSCEADEGCLSALGAECHAQRVLWVNVVPNSAPQSLRVSGKVVRSDGLAGANALDAEVARSPKASRDAQLSAVLHSFLLKLISMEFAPPAGAAREAAALAPPGAASAQGLAEGAAPAGKGLSVAGYTVGAAGLASLLSAGVIAWAAQGERSQLQKLLDPAGQRPGSAQAGALVGSLNAKSTAATATLVGGAALVAAGASLVVVGKTARSREVRVALCPGPQGGAVLVAGGF